MAGLSVTRRHADLRGGAIYLGMTEKALRKLVERRKVPFRKRGGRLMFDLDALDSWARNLPGASIEEALANSQ